MKEYKCFRLGWTFDKFMGALAKRVDQHRRMNAPWEPVRDALRAMPFTTEVYWRPEDIRIFENCANSEISYKHRIKGA